MVERDAEGQVKGAAGCLLTFSTRFTKLIGQSASRPATPTQHIFYIRKSWQETWSQYFIFSFEYCAMRFWPKTLAALATAQPASLPLRSTVPIQNGLQMTIGLFNLFQILRVELSIAAVIGHILFIKLMKPQVFDDVVPINLTRHPKIESFVEIGPILCVAKLLGSSEPTLHDRDLYFVINPLVRVIERACLKAFYINSIPFLANRDHFNRFPNVIENMKVETTIRVSNCSDNTTGAIAIFIDIGLVEIIMNIVNFDEQGGCNTIVQLGTGARHSQSG
ncbi:hypothetical protein BDV26DRAFT_292045 [Aspergillus bertholletiae]|uniref:Uncharacterized protein n=1 Tax=Aspergillus bertholletiae TaxID=1226010 RepID=A0A5N7BA79_9EURO|nr:hypothetical protein BDV26DRAFT_292045 [Aspergillus bertholletiae]